MSHSLVRHAALAAALILAVRPGVAHNASVHRDMTDRAWEVMIALTSGRLQDTPLDADMAELRGASARAIRALQALPAGLPRPRRTVCNDPAAIKKFGASPNWGAGSDFASLTMGAVPYPVATTYMTANDCGADVSWTPGAFFDAINASGQPGGIDHTGAVLGFWAHQPDDEENDWHINFRVTNAGGLGVVKSYLATAAGAAVGTVWVPLKCALECAGSLLGLGGSCKSCLDDAIEDAKTAVHEGIASIDGLVPGFGDHTSLDLYTGMGHHINVTGVQSVGPWKLNPGAFDNHPGLLVENTGPLGVPDSIEFLALAAADGLGMSVHWEPSLGPKRYEIRNQQDFHPDSTHRTEDDWQFLSFAHTPFTPLDNLALFGWSQFKAKPAENVKYLGWSLHAFGDAIVPMHVAGTFGWGHRPYEDAFEQRAPRYLNTSDASAARAQALDILRRAVAWRKLVKDWRALHPERGNDVPVRDMVTRLAQFTWAKVQSPDMFDWPFNPAMSSQYLVPVTGKAIALPFYELHPRAEAVNRDLLAEGVAAELAFIVSAAEVLP